MSVKTDFSTIAFSLLPAYEEVQSSLSRRVPLEMNRSERNVTVEAMSDISFVLGSRQVIQYCMSQADQAITLEALDKIKYVESNWYDSIVHFFRSLSSTYRKNYAGSIEKVDRFAKALIKDLKIKRRHCYYKPRIVATQQKLIEVKESRLSDMKSKLQIKIETRARVLKEYQQLQNEYSETQEKVQNLPKGKVSVFIETASSILKKRTWPRAAYAEALKKRVCPGPDVNSEMTRKNLAALDKEILKEGTDIITSTDELTVQRQRLSANSKEIEDSKDSIFQNMQKLDNLKRVLLKLPEQPIRVRYNVPQRVQSQIPVLAVERAPRTETNSIETEFKALIKLKPFIDAFCSELQGFLPEINELIRLHTRGGMLATLELCAQGLSTQNKFNNFIIKQDKIIKDEHLFSDFKILGKKFKNILITNNIVLSLSQESPIHDLFQILKSNNISLHFGKLAVIIEIMKRSEYLEKEGAKNNQEIQEVLKKLEETVGIVFSILNSPALR